MLDARYKNLALVVVLLMVLASLYCLFGEGFISGGGFSPISEVYQFPYYGISTEKVVKITQDSHIEEINLSREPDLDVALITVIPKALSENISGVEIASSGSIVVLESDPLIKFENKNSPNSLAVRYEFSNPAKDISTINILIPEFFLNNLSEYELENLKDKLKKISDLNESELTTEKAKEIEGKINANLEKLFIADANLSSEEKGNETILFEEVSSRFKNVSPYDVLSAIDDALKKPGAGTAGFEIVFEFKSPRADLLENPRFKPPEAIVLTISEEIPKAYFEMAVAYPERVTDIAGAAELEEVPLKDVSIPGLNPNTYIIRKVIGEPAEIELEFDFSTYFPSRRIITNVELSFDTASFGGYKKIKIPLLILPTECKASIVEESKNATDVLLEVIDCQRQITTNRKYEFEQRVFDDYLANEALVDAYLSTHHVEFADEARIAELSDLQDVELGEKDAGKLEVYTDRYDPRLLSKITGYIHNNYENAFKQVKRSHENVIAYLAVFRDNILDALGDEDLAKFIQNEINVEYADMQVWLSYIALKKDPDDKGARDRFVDNFRKYLYYSLFREGRAEEAAEVTNNKAAFETDAKEQLTKLFGNRGRMIAELETSADLDLDYAQELSDRLAEINSEIGELERWLNNPGNWERHGAEYGVKNVRCRKLQEEKEILEPEVPKYQAREQAIRELKELVVSEQETILSAYKKSLTANSASLRPAFDNPYIKEILRVRQYFQKPFIHSVDEAEALYATVAQLESERERLIVAITELTNSALEDVEINLWNVIRAISHAKIDETLGKFEQRDRLVYQKYGIHKLIKEVEDGNSLIEIYDNFNWDDYQILAALKNPTVESIIAWHRFYSSGEALGLSETEVKEKMWHEDWYIAKSYEDLGLNAIAAEEYARFYVKYDDIPHLRDKANSKLKSLENKEYVKTRAHIIKELTTPRELAIFAAIGLAAKLPALARGGFAFGKLATRAEILAEVTSAERKIAKLGKFHKIKKALTKEITVFKRFNKFIGDKAMKRFPKLTNILKADVATSLELGVSKIRNAYKRFKLGRMLGGEVSSETLFLPEIGKRYGFLQSVSRRDLKVIEWMKKKRDLPLAAHDFSFGGKSAKFIELENEFIILFDDGRVFRAFIPSRQEATHFYEQAKALVDKYKADPELMRSLGFDGDALQEHLEIYKLVKEHSLTAGPAGVYPISPRGYLNPAIVESYTYYARIPLKAEDVAAGLCKIEAGYTEFGELIYSAYTPAAELPTVAMLESAFPKTKFIKNVKPGDYEYGFLLKTEKRGEYFKALETYKSEGKLPAGIKSFEDFEEHLDAVGLHIRDAKTHSILVEDVYENVVITRQRSMVEKQYFTLFHEVTHADDFKYFSIAGQINKRVMTHLEKFTGMRQLAFSKSAGYFSESYIYLEGLPSAEVDYFYQTLSFMQQEIYLKSGKLFDEALFAEKLERLLLTDERFARIYSHSYRQLLLERPNQFSGVVAAENPAEEMASILSSLRHKYRGDVINIDLSSVGSTPMGHFIAGECASGCVVSGRGLPNLKQTIVGFDLPESELFRTLVTTSAGEKQLILQVPQKGKAVRSLILQLDSESTAGVPIIIHPTELESTIAGTLEKGKLIRGRKISEIRIPGGEEGLQVERILIHKPTGHYGGLFGDDPSATLVRIVNIDGKRTLEIISNRLDFAVEFDATLKAGQLRVTANYGSAYRQLEKALEEARRTGKTASHELIPAVTETHAAMEEGLDAIRSAFFIDPAVEGAITESGFKTALIHALEDAAGAGPGAGKSYRVMAISVDDFKQLNTLFGNDVVDKIVLSRAVKRIKFVDKPVKVFDEVAVAHPYGDQLFVAFEDSSEFAIEATSILTGAESHILWPVGGGVIPPADMLNLRAGISSTSRSLGAIQDNPVAVVNAMIDEALQAQAMSRFVQVEPYWGRIALSEAEKELLMEKFPRILSQREPHLVEYGSLASEWESLPESLRSRLFIPTERKVINYETIRTPLDDAMGRLTNTANAAAERTYYTANEIDAIGKSMVNFNEGVESALGTIYLDTHGNLVKKDMIDFVINKFHSGGKQPTLFKLDFDNFGEINNTLGRTTGDAVIRDSTAIIRREAKLEGGYLVRGSRNSDEMYVILPKELSSGEAGEFLTRINSRIEQKFPDIRVYDSKLGEEVGIHLSGGYTKQISPPEVMLRQANVAAQNAPRLPSGGLVEYTSDLYNPGVYAEPMQFEESLLDLLNTKGSVANPEVGVVDMFLSNM